MLLTLATRAPSRPSPLATLAAVLLFLGAFGLLRGRLRGGPSEPCDPAEAECAPAADADAMTQQAAAAPVLSADDACRDVGYLCAGLAGEERIQLRRWPTDRGTLVVSVPRPEFESSGDAIRLQEAAVRGLRAWNGQPFQIATDMRGDQEADFSVRWSTGLGGAQIGVTHSQWSAAAGLRVLSIELSTRSPFDPGRVIDPRQVRLTAAHEMGHALGLPHSDEPRDVMYPTNTATSLSARDYRTMEALYRLQDGTAIVR